MIDNEIIAKANKHCQDAYINGKLGGIIYSYINEENGKRYVGQTTRPRMRHYQHTKAVAKDSSPWYLAIQKYGWDKFSYEILKTVVADSEEELHEELDRWETYYMETLQSMSHQSGYNIRLGHQRGNSVGREFKKAVDMYDMQGNFIRTFSCISEANLCINHIGPGIRNVCNGDCDSSGGYLWTWRGEKVRIPEQKAIGQYDLKGKFIRSFKNAFEASRILKKHCSAIHNAINEKHRIAYDSYWRDYVADEIPITDFPNAIFIYDLQGNFVRGFHNYKEAISEVKASGTSAICAAIKRKHAYKGFLWRKEYANKIDPFENRKFQNIAIVAHYPDGTVKKYTSIKAAAIDNDVTISAVRSSFEGRNSKTNKNIVFERLGEINEENTIDSIDLKELNGKDVLTPGRITQPVDQYDKNGNFIKTFPTIAAAEKELALNNISGAIYNKEMCGGYIWTRAGEPIPKKIIERLEAMKVYCYNSNGDFVAAYANKEEAAIGIGYASPNSHIGRCIKEPWRTAKGFYWRNKKHDKIIIPHKEN